jgi:AraC-like DNA-binding protein
MAILSKRMLHEVSRAYFKAYGLRPLLMDLSGRVLHTAEDQFAALTNIRRRRSYALQESISQGCAYVFQPAPRISSWILALEDRRMIHGALVGGAVLRATRKHLESHGLSPRAAGALLNDLSFWTESRVQEAARALYDGFYQISGWQPELMKENRLRIQQQEQINEAVQEQRRSGNRAIYAFEKERALLAHIRTGDRNGARRLLNDMLAAIYLSSSHLVVLRARAVEMMSCLTRAAIEDNPLLEPLIERNHRWTEQLVQAASFEDLSQVLMDALDDFVDGVYLHGVNRSNAKVHRALDYISTNYATRITLRTAAKEVGLSPCRLAHLVKEFTGKTILQIVQQVRIRHAQHMLERTSKTCTEIAYDVGYEDQSYFIKQFRRLTGTTPARYRRFRGSPAREDAAETTT